MSKKEITEESTNVAAEVRAQIKELLDKRHADIQEIKDKRAAAYSQKDAAEASLKEATKEMNLEAYETAKEASRKAQTAIDMYTARLNQLNQLEFISEEESDLIIGKLLGYENRLDREFKQAITPHVKALAEILDEYQKNVNDTEFVIRAWTESIHPNYQSDTTTYADGTHRSPVPVPVHIVAFTGCDESKRLDSYLQNETKLYL